LAAARLLAHGAAPVMPRFASRLAAALGLPEPTEWPRVVELVSAGTRVDLARQVFFGAVPFAPAAASPTAAAPASPLLPWLAAQTRAALKLAGDEPIDDKTLVELGMESLQCIALQYKILEGAGVDVSVEDLLGGRTVAELAAFVAAGCEPDTVTALTGAAPA
jgi:methionyl-tRNA synthetase